ncbi:MAG: PTS glucose transporter subunit IIA [Synergistaceae bacterium]|nr:PTS glucose transporter subunit IIA [Synergistaceae bacterium]
MFGFGSKKLVLLAPLTGAQKSLEDVPDPVFSGKIMGDGVAIEPASDVEGFVKAPCDGEVATLFPTGHAVGILVKPGSGEEIELLIHVGIDTVELKDGPFEALVKQGDSVKTGQPLIRFDVAKIKGAGKATITPFLVTNPDSVESMKVLPGPYTAGETPILELQPKK